MVGGKCDAAEQHSRPNRVLDLARALIADVNDRLRNEEEDDARFGHLILPILGDKAREIVHGIVDGGLCTASACSAVSALANPEIRPCLVNSLGRKETWRLLGEVLKAQGGMRRNEATWVLRARVLSAKGLHRWANAERISAEAVQSSDWHWHGWERADMFAFVTHVLIKHRKSRPHLDWQELENLVDALSPTESASEQAALAENLALLGLRMVAWQKARSRHLDGMLLRGFNKLEAAVEYSRHVGLHHPIHALCVRAREVAEWDLWPNDPHWGFLWLWSRAHSVSYERSSSASRPRIHLERARLFFSYEPGKI